MDNSQFILLRFMQVILTKHSLRLLVLNHNQLKQEFKWIKVKIVDLSLVATSRIYNEAECHWGRLCTDWKKAQLRINSFSQAGMT